MVGFPKYLNSKDDYLYVRDNFPREQWLPELQKLLDTMYGWFYVSTLVDGNAGVTDDTHKVETMDDGSRLQYEYRVNETCKLYQLGFKVDEVNQLMEDN